MSQCKCKLTPWNSRKQQTKRRVHGTGDNYRNYQHGPMPVCPEEAELEGCAINVVSALQPPVFQVAQKELSHLWKLNVILPQICRSWILKLWFISYSWLLSSWQQWTTPCSSKRKKNTTKQNKKTPPRTEKQPCFNWINFLPTSIVTDERTSFFESS